MSTLKLKRIYDAPEHSDGIRVLVDRLWPRGLSRQQARIDYWLKDIAPSSQLRKWYGHDLSRWDEFKRRYFDELAKQTEHIAVLRQLMDRHVATLLYSARSTDHNNAVALAEFLMSKDRHD